jgi:ABC-type uncharacterized transport system auxiliary subunit
MTKWYLLFGIVLVIWLGGCANVPLTHYYAFQPDFETKTVTAPPKYDRIIAVDVFEADIPYQQDKIVFRTSPYEVSFYEYHKWLRPLGELLAEQALKVLASAGMFPQVQPYTPELASDYILRARIKMFDHWHSAQQSFVQVVIQYQLTTTQDERPIWRERIATTAQITNFQVIEIVKGFETAVHDNILQALSAMDGVLSHQLSHE